MRKLILILILASFSLAGISQNLFKPIPKDYFARKALGFTSQWIPRISTGISAISYGRNPETNLLEVTPLSALSFGMSLLLYKNTSTGPFNTFGFSLMYLQLTDKVGSGLGLYGTYNTGQIGLLNIGGHYDFNAKRFLLDTGITWHF